MKKEPINNNARETLNGVTVGAWMMLIGALWFTFPFIFNGRFMYYPIILFGLGLVTLARHGLRKPE